MAIYKTWALIGVRKSTKERLDKIKKTLRSQNIDARKKVSYESVINYLLLHSGDLLSKDKDDKQTT